MDVADAKREKKILEEQIRHLLLDFEDRTGCYIDIIDIEWQHGDREVEVAVAAKL